jgi:hypothetical protein
MTTSRRLSGPRCDAAEEPIGASSSIIDRSGATGAGRTSPDLALPRRPRPGASVCSAAGPTTATSGQGFPLPLHRNRPVPSARGRRRGRWERAGNSSERALVPTGTAEIHSGRRSPAMTAETDGLCQPGATGWRTMRKTMDAEGLLVGVLATHHVAVAVIDEGAVAVNTTGTETEEQNRPQRADNADDHEDHTNGVQIHPVLIGACCDGEVKDRSDSESHQTGDETTGHGNLPHSPTPHHGAARHVPGTFERQTTDTSTGFPLRH